MRDWKLAGVALLVIGSAVRPAAAQDTICVYGDTGSGLDRLFRTTPGVPFDVVVLMEADSASAAAEFVVTELKLEYPSLFKLSVTRANSTELDLGDNSVGEYVMEFGACLEPGPIELVRISYGDFGGVLSGVPLSIGGLDEGATQPSHFGGAPGYLYCSATGAALEPEPWPSDGYPCDPADYAPQIGSAAGMAFIDNFYWWCPDPLLPTGMSGLKTRYDRDR